MNWTMNWKLILVATVALLLGFAISPFGHGKVAAAVTAPSGTHFQLLSAIVDDAPADQSGTGLPFGPTNRVFPYHELFLLNTETGKVWEYAPGTITAKADGTKQNFPPTFIPIERGPRD